MCSNEQSSGNANSSDQLTICAIQPQLRPDSQTPEHAVEHVIQLMHKATVRASGSPGPTSTDTGTTSSSSSQDETIDLFVLPELSPLGYSEHTFAQYLPETSAKQQMYKDLDVRMAEAAQQLGAYICYGTIGWHAKQQHEGNNNNNTSNDNKNTNHTTPLLDFTIRQIVVDPSSGQKVAVYDKMYLCDFGDCAETRFFVPSPSQEPVSFAIGNFRMGLMICADQRVPTLARTYAGTSKHNVDVLLQPAAFVRDVSFATWKSFRETRAVENSCYFIGVNYSGDDYGETTLVPPWVDDSGNPDSTAISLGRDESWLHCRVERSVLQQVRTTFPFYRILTAEAAVDA